MKHKFSLCVLLCAIVFFSGCGEKTSDSPISEDQAYANLLEEIVSFEDANGFTLNLETKRGFWNKIGKIAGCDAGGFLMGAFMGPELGALCGVLSSIFNAIFIVNYDKLDCSCLEYTNDLSQMAPSLNGVGFEHNLIVKRFYDQKSFISSSKNPVAMINKVISIYKQSHPNIEISSYEELVAVCPKIGDMINCTSEDEVIDISLSEISSQEELAVVRRVLSAVCSLQNRSDLAVYGNTLQTLIASSSVSDQGKQRLYSILSIGLYSRTFWDYEMQ